MSSPAERIECREVLYCCQSASIPGVLLYTAGELAFVEFETRNCPGYRGFSVYKEVAIFPEHWLRRSCTKTSRAKDPSLHRHVLIANVTIDPERNEALAMSCGDMFENKGDLVSEPAKDSAQISQLIRVA